MNFNLKIKPNKTEKKDYISFNLIINLISFIFFL